jgi:RNA polymerase sigma-70 factor (ECF subfamily)
MDPGAFERLLVPERERLLAYLVGMTGERERALDLAQESYLAAWQGLAGFRGESAPLTWLIGIARRLHMRWARRERRRVWLLSEAARWDERPGLAALRATRTDEAFAAAERERRVRLAVLALPIDRREVVVLRYFVGLDIEEIARATGTRAGTVKSRLARARAALARQLAEEIEE